MGIEAERHLRLSYFACEHAEKRLGVSLTVLVESC